MATSLENLEMQTALSRPRARLRVASRFGIPASLLHSLRYRPPKTIAADVYARLAIAIERQAAEQIRSFEHEIAKARARGLGAADRRLWEAEAAVRHARALLEKAVRAID
ncbi:MAG: hypothetical protein ACREC4_00805 [Methylocella sp.]